MSIVRTYEPRLVVRGVVSTLWFEEGRVHILLATQSARWSHLGPGDEYLTDIIGGRILRAAEIATLVEAYGDPVQLEEEEEYRARAADAEYAPDCDTVEESLGLR